jgi:hypothetical protein
VTTRPPWVRRRNVGNDAGLGAFMVVLLLASIVVLVIAAQKFGAVAPREIPLLSRLRQSSATTRPIDGAVRASPVLDRAIADAGRRGDTSVPASASAPMAPPLPVLAVGSRARVVNTDGAGVVLRSAPRDSARRPAGLFEGDAVTVLDLAGGDWAQVQGGRQTGWVPTAFLAPAE